MEVSMGLLIFVLILASFLGFELISKVPSQLHTPLMSGSNAISGIAVVGAILSLLGSFQVEDQLLRVIFGSLAVFFATVNVVRCTAVATVGGNVGGRPFHGICTLV